MAGEQRKTKVEDAVSGCLVKLNYTLFGSNMTFPEHHVLSAKTDSL